MSLTRVAKNTRIGVKVFIAFFILYYIVTLIVIPLSGNIINQLFPSKDKPTLAFGVLPAIKFEPTSIEGTILSYKLNTRSGQLPNTLPDKLPVYKYKSQPRSFEAQKNASIDAKILGFEDKDLATDVRGDTLRWFNPDAQSNLQIQVQTKELFLDTLYQSKTGLYPQGSINQANAVAKAKDILTKIRRFSDLTYTTGYQNTYMGKFGTRQIVNTDIAFEMQVARVDFFRNINNYSIYGPDYKEALISVVVGTPQDPSGRENLTIFTAPKIQYYYNEIDTNPNATYPLISVQTAWDAIQKNEGIVSSVHPKDASFFEKLGPQKVDRVLVNNIKVGYLDTKIPQKYLQPIYIFEGNYTAAGGGSGAIVLYYPALSPENVDYSQE